LKKQECKTKIEELDKTLSVLKEGWNSVEGKEKNKWMERINSLLDQRFMLMQARDKKPNVKKIKANE
jgi:hypothetical protein